jgi:hypothetical protein
MTKKNMWIITATEVRRLKVEFEMPVTAEEAVELFMTADYEDIIDEETIDTEDAVILDADLDTDLDTDEDEDE